MKISTIITILLILSILANTFDLIPEKPNNLITLVLFGFMVIKNAKDSYDTNNETNFFICILAIILIFICIVIQLQI